MFKSTVSLTTLLTNNQKSIISCLTLICELLNAVFFVRPVKIYNSIIENHLEEIDYSLKYYMEPHLYANAEFSKDKNYDFVKDIVEKKIIAEYKTNPSVFQTTINPMGYLKEYKILTIEFHRVETPFIIGIWIFFASLAKIGFHMAPKFSKIFPESCLLIVVGVVIGLFLFQINNVHMSPLTPDTFFLYMLPPIILDAGYFMPNRLFFDHLGTILLFAVIGTIFNTLSIGLTLWLIGRSGFFSCETPILDMLLFAALVSAVDPVAVLAVFEEIHVNEILYIVVFGESLLNDAVTVVLYHMFEAYSEMGHNRISYSDILSGFASFFVVAIGGTIIGVIWGFTTGFVTRFTNQVRVIEPIFIFVMAYLAYLTAEIFHMSGILAITFCGITMKNYVEANISYKSHTTVKYTMKMLSSSSETIIFMFLGVATVNNKHNWNSFFIITTIVLCSVYRIVGVIVLSAVANQFRLHKLNSVEKFVMSYGGLRGAVAFALVLLIDVQHVPLQPMFVTTTITVIYFTVFFQGITIKPLVKILNVKRAEKRKPTMNERIHERIIDHIMAGVEDILGKHGNYHVRDKFKRFDNRYIRPYLLRNYFGAEPKILETYSKLTMKDAMEYIRRNASTIGSINGIDSMSTIFRSSSNTDQFNSSPCYQYESGWNIDFQELEYNPSKKDLTDAKIHHLLAEELCKPYKRHRRLSYSRHAVDDKDLSTQVNYKMHNIRRAGEHKHRSKRNKKIIKEGKNHVSFPESPSNFVNKRQELNRVTDTAKYLDCDSDLEEQLQFHATDWESAITFTARSLGDITPTATETVLPWKREEDSPRPLKQHEFPTWCSNKDYLVYSSPYTALIGEEEESKKKPVVNLLETDLFFQTLNSDFNKHNEQANVQNFPPHVGFVNIHLKTCTNNQLMTKEEIDIDKDKTSHSFPQYLNNKQVCCTGHRHNTKESARLSSALIASYSDTSTEFKYDEN